MSRSFLILLIFLVVLVAALYYLSTIDTEVETQTIEQPVSDEALEN